MRYLTFGLLLLSALVARAEDISGLNAFAEEYWSAIRTQDPQKIFAFYDSKVFSELSPAEADFLKEYWIKSYLNAAKQQGDSYQITAKALPAEANLLPTWRWAAKPQYQIEIQTFKNVENGKENLTMLGDVVVQKEGRFFIIRPVPPEDVLQNQLMKKKGQ
jgi:hypothetical protein